jgi:hypothetical protein
MQSYTTNFRCQAENTLTFTLILWAFCESPVEMLVEKMWIKMWKISEGF